MNASESTAEHLDEILAAYLAGETQVAELQELESLLDNGGEAAERIARRKVALVVGEGVQGDRDHLDLRGRLGPPGLHPRAADGRHKDRDQQRNDRHHHQQLDQRERPSASRFHVTPP